jgi:hypothetical protein
MGICSRRLPRGARWRSRARSWPTASASCSVLPPPSRAGVCHPLAGQRAHQRTHQLRADLLDHEVPSLEAGAAHAGHPHAAHAARWAARRGARRRDPRVLAALPDSASSRRSRAGELGLGGRQTRVRQPALPAPRSHRDPQTRADRAAGAAGAPRSAWRHAPARATSMSARSNQAGSATRVGGAGCSGRSFASPRSTALTKPATRWPRASRTAFTLAFTAACGGTRERCCSWYTPTRKRCARERVHAAPASEARLDACVERRQGAQHAVHDLGGERGVHDRSRCGASARRPARGWPRLPLDPRAAAPRSRWRARPALRGRCWSRGDRGCPAIGARCRS